MELVYRNACAEQTLAQFKDLRFEWGRADCVRMGVAHVRRMGHKFALAKAGSYRTARSAKAALKRAGFDSIESALDARFNRIPPAAALPSDLLTLEGMDGLSAIAVRLTHGRALCTYQGGFAIVQPLEYVAAWRVPCLITEVPKWVTR